MKIAKQDNDSLKTGRWCLLQVVITDKSVAVVETLETLLPNLRRLSSAKLDTQQTDDLVSMLDTLILQEQVFLACQLRFSIGRKLLHFTCLNFFTRMCHLENEPEEAHAMNQSILYNHGKRLNQHMIMIINSKYI